MIALKNNSPSVSVLDPVADRNRLSTRYCSCGSIFQVEDSSRGILLSCPTFPDSYNLFDGQGAPDAFQSHLVVEQDADDSPSLVLGIGIGLVDAKANVVGEWCQWGISQGDGFQTGRLRSVPPRKRGAGASGW